MVLESDVERETFSREIEEDTNQEKYEGVLYKMADWILGVRKKIKDSQPEWYKNLGTW